MSAIRYLSYHYIDTVLRHDDEPPDRSVAPTADQGEPMKARWLTAVSLGVVVLAASACSSGSSGSSDSSGGKSGAAQDFVILDVTAVSGPYAVIGDPEVQATKAAVNYFNSRGGFSGHKIVLEVKDDQGDASTAVSILQQALSSGTKPDLVLPGVTSNETVALLPLLARNSLLSIATTGAGQISDPAKYPLSFGASFEPQDGPNSEASYLAQKGYKTIGVLHADDAYGTSWATQISAALAAQKLKEVSVSYDPTALDLSPDMSKLDSYHPDVILAEAFGAPVPAIYAARVKLGNYSIPLVADNTIAAGNPWGTIKNPAAFKNSVEQAYSVTKYEPPATQRPAITTMLTWVKKLGPVTAALSLYALSWDALQTVKAAVAATGSLDSVKLAKAMENLSRSDAQWTQDGGAAPGYTSTIHFAVSQPGNYVYLNPGPQVDGMISSAG
jgi:branched-chain amino acid transport system substrate-binding protein